MKCKQPLKKLENTANWRKGRGLTLYGRAQIISSLLLPKLIYIATMFAVPEEVVKDISCGYTHLGFGVFRRVNGLGWDQPRFHVTLGDAVTQ